MSYRQTARLFSVSHSVIVRLKQRVNQTGSVNERERIGRPMKTTSREDRLFTRLARQQPFSIVNTEKSIDFQWAHYHTDRQQTSEQCKVSC
jgi:transposase